MFINLDISAEPIPFSISQMLQNIVDRDNQFYQQVTYFPFEFHRNLINRRENYFPRSESIVYLSFAHFLVKFYIVHVFLRSLFLDRTSRKQNSQSDRKKWIPFVLGKSTSWTIFEINWYFRCFWTLPEKYWLQGSESWSRTTLYLLSLKNCHRFQKKNILLSIRFSFYFVSFWWRKERRHFRSEDRRKSELFSKHLIE